MLDSSLTNEVVLAVTAVVLLCGSAGLLLVSLSSPLLRGLMWVSSSFALGGGSALLMCAQNRLSLPFVTGVADVLMLGCFVSLDLGVRAVHSEATRLSALSLGLLAAQFLISAFFFRFPEQAHLRAIGSAALLAAQACASGWRLVKHEGDTPRAPVLLCGCLLLAYALLLGLHNGALGSGLLRSHRSVAAVQAGVSIGILAVILGIAFSFFWMTTSVFARGLEHMASTDPLTRIFNRRTFLLWCEKELGRSLTSGTPFSLLLVDLDHFKRVNDVFGHPVGDRLLCQVVERLQDAVRGIDVLGRWGGEEFAVLLPRASAEAAFLVAERVRRNIERSSMELSAAEAGEGSRQLQVTASLGTSTFRGPGDSIGALFQRADAALYTAKRRGRNCTATSQTTDLMRPPDNVPAGDLPRAVLHGAETGAPELVT